MKPLTIQSHQGNYPVRFFPQVGPLVEQLANLPNPLVIIDRNVFRLYESSFAPLAKAVPLLQIDAKEENKTLKGAEEVLLFMQQHNCTKSSRLIAIGGGIIQDIAGFAAHLYYRGIQWHLVPTTLLSIGDSCIGAKTGLNLGEFKNQIGSFHSPSEILICPDFIDTLEPNDTLSGYGEILKLLLIHSAEKYQFLCQSFEQGINPETRLKLIQSSLATKKEVIEEDEYETGVRKHLNYGHTFGHALEALTNHQVPHGLAVVFGLDLVNYYAVQKGWLDEHIYQDIHQHITNHFALPKTKNITTKALVDLTRRDKKVTEGKLQLAVLRDWGKMDVQLVPFDEELEQFVGAYLQIWNQRP